MANWLHVQSRTLETDILQKLCIGQMIVYKYLSCVCQKGLFSVDELSGVTRHVRRTTHKFLMPSILCVIKLPGAISRT